MKIRPKVPMFLGGSNIWYLNLKDYDSSLYKYGYDTTLLVDGDMYDNVFKPWISNIRGYDTLHRYQPTTGHGIFGEGKEHFNYTQKVERQPYYNDKFGADLIDKNTGKFTPMGEAWAKAVDALLPKGSQASFYDPNTNKIRSLWTTQYRDAHGRPARTFTNLADYVNYVRNDQILGARHNVFLNKGKRYFYKDKDGKEHWVNPEDISEYSVSKDPVRSNWNDDHTIYWDDYELTGPKNSPNPQQEDPNKPGGSVEEQHNEYGGFDWNKINEGLKRMYPGLIGAGRLAGTLISNNRIYNEALKGIRPNLMLSYHTHRQVVGDEATKLAYYRRAAQGLTRAAQPFTADADRQIAYQNEAKRIGDELRAQGDLADNAEIRRTSDESNQHQWDNRKRDTEIANANTASINQANALRQNLLAQKHASDWSSINNYLLEKETRARQADAEEQAIQDQLWLLLELQNLENDDTYADLYKKAAEDAEKGLTTSENIRAFKNYRTQLEINRLKNRPRRNSGFFLFAKKGTALEYKKKDDLLYKTARDVVEHFRKMSKYSSDSYNRRPIKIEKLAPHPKGNTRRYLLGGMAPFVVYTPAPMGGETTMSSQASTSGSGSGKGSGKDESLELVKSLFKEIGGNGLPIDVNLVYNNIQKLFNLSKILGTEMTSSDIASVYLLAMLLLSNIKYSLDSFNKLEQLAANNEALNEFAVTADGLYVVSDKDGILSYEKSLEKIIKEGKNPITNQQLLNMRAYSPNLAFSKGDYIIDNVIANGMGINKIGAQIKALAGNLGSTEGKLEGISQVESGKVRAGLQILSGTQGTPDGYYSVTNTGKDLKGLIKAAVNYISNMLSPSQKAILQAHGGVELNIMSFLTSQEDYTREQTISPLTGKASNKGSGSGSGNNDMLPSVAFFNGLGEKDSFIILDKTNDGLKIDVVSTPITSKGYNTGSITFDKLESSDFGGLLLINLATMGDSQISSTGRNNIIIDGRIYLTELPIDQEAKRTTGIIKPDLRFLKKIEAADAKLKQMGIDKSDPKNIATVNKVYLENNLPILYTISNNKPTITSEYARFAIVNGVGTEDAFGDNPEFNDAIKEVSSDKERLLFETMMLQLGNSKYKLDNGIGIFGYSIGETKLYKGTIYIPMVTSNISALAGTGFKANGEEYNEIEARQQAANAAREMGFNPAGDASNLL